MNPYQSHQPPAGSPGPQHNPYQAPNTGYLAPPPSGTGEVSPGVMEALKDTRPWVRFMAILTFVMTGLMMIGGLGIAALGRTGGPAFNLGLAIGYILMAFLYVFPGIYMYRYGTAIGHLQEGGGVPALEDAMRQQRSFWRFVGIMALVVVCIYGLIIVFALFAGIAAGAGAL